METSRTIRLNLEKFISLLEKHKYILVSVYCEKNTIRFVECRTPKYQKTFVVYLPKKYEMKLPTNSPLKRLNIAGGNDPPSARQSKYMTDMKGHLLECDLLSISSDVLCAFHDVGKAECFHMEENTSEEDEPEETEAPEESDEIKKLESDTTTLLQKVKPGATLPKPKVRERKEQEDVVSENTDEPEPEDDEEGDDEEVFPEEDTVDEGEESTLEHIPSEEESGVVELIFEDEDGEPYDEVKDILNSSSKAEKSISSLQEKIKKKDAEDFDEDDGDDDEVDISSGDNSLPKELEEAEVTLGIIYVMVTIATFFKKISTGAYEEEVIKCYEQLEDNEVDMRKERLASIKILCQKFTQHSEDRMSYLATEESNLKMQLLRLTVVLAQSEQLLNKVELHPEKYGPEIVSETKKIYQHTRDTIHNINTEILKLRDTADELLSNYSSSIKDLMEM